MSLWHGKHIGQRLIEAGLCSTYTRDVQLHIPIDGPFFMRCDVFLDTEGLRTLAAAVMDEDRHERARRLIEAGVCPPFARNVEMHAPRDGALFIRYERLLDTEALRTLAGVLAAVADEGDRRKRPTT